MSYYYYGYGIGVTSSEARSIANVLSGQLKVKIKEGQAWAYNFKDKAITYRKEDLYSLTSKDVTANLLHEAGHAKYSLCPSKLKWGKNVKKKHQVKLKHIVNVIEDFRIEDKVRVRYPHAKTYLPLYSFKTEFELNFFANQYQMNTGKISRYLGYCFGLYSEIADLPIYFQDPDITKAVKKTKKAGKAARYLGSTQAIADVISKDIYPHIVKFLEEHEEKALEGVKLVLSMGNPPADPWQDLYPEVKHLVAPTTAYLSRVLTDNKFDKFGGKFASGAKIDSRRLYKFRVGDTRLFQRRILRKTKDYAFSFLVDASGSMRGGPMREAVKAAILFSHTLGRLNIPFSIHSFNTRLKDYKQLGEEFIPFGRKTANMWEDIWDESGSSHAGGTWDATAIRSHSNKMAKYSGKKIMFVITDGDTNDGDYSLKNEVRKAEARGIEMVGIGIGGYAGEFVRDNYKDHAYVDDIEKLPKVLAVKLKEKLALKGGI